MTPDVPRCGAVDPKCSPMCGYCTCARPAGHRGNHRDVNGAEWTNTDPSP